MWAIWDTNCFHNVVRNCGEFLLFVLKLKKKLDKNNKYRKLSFIFDSFDFGLGTISVVEMKWYCVRIISRMHSFNNLKCSVFVYTVYRFAFFPETLHLCNLYFGCSSTKNSCTYARGLMIIKLLELYRIRNSEVIASIFCLAKIVFIS